MQRPHRSHPLARRRAFHIRPPGGSTRSAFGNTVLVRLTFAYLLATVAEWAFFVGALVYAFDHGGSGAAGLASLALLVPTAVFAPAAGVTIERRRPHGVLLVSYAVQIVVLGASTIAAFAEAPVAVVVGGCAIASGAFAFLRPASAVLLPAIVRSARELTVANVWVGWCDSVSMLAGPFLATVMLVVQGPALVLAACAALTLVSTLVTLPHDRTESPPATHTDVAESVGAVRLVFRSIKALRTRAGASGVLAIAGGHYLLIGSLDLTLVVLANDALELDDSGPGLLATSVGIGAVISALGSTILVGRDRLAPLLVGALGSIAIASLALGLAPTLAAALALLPIVGFSSSLLSLTSRMLLQRATPPHNLAAVFAALELLAGVAMVVGSIATQLLIAAGGVDTALIGLGAFFAVLLVLTWRSLRVADDSADIPIVAISLLRRIPAFAPLPPVALETVARAATEVSVTAGQVVMTEGEEGECFYAIADGWFDVFVAGTHIRTVGRGAGFGEIALLANVARTATVTATCPGALLAIHRVPFLVAVTGSDSSRQAAWGVIRTMTLNTDVDLDDPTKT